MKPSTRAHILMIAVTLVWGSTFALVKDALQDVSPVVFNLLRMGMAFLILAAVSPWSLRGLTRRELGFGALAGLFLGLGYQFQTAGLARTTVTKSAFLTGLVVVIVPLLSSIPGVRRANAARPNLMTYLGALLAFAGLILLTIPAGGVEGKGYAGLFSGRYLISGLHLGEYLTLACAVAFSAHLLTLSRGAQHVTARRMGTLQIGFCALTILLTFPLAPHPVLHLTGRVVLALAVTATLGTAAAFTIQSYAQQHIPASHTALICTLELVFAWFTAFLFLHERLGRREVGGAGLILAGILVAELLAPQRGDGRNGNETRMLHQASEIPGTGVAPKDG